MKMEGQRKLWKRSRKKKCTNMTMQKRLKWKNTKRKWEWKMNLKTWIQISRCLWKWKTVGLKYQKNRPVLSNPISPEETPLLGKSLLEIPPVTSFHKPPVPQMLSNLKKKVRNHFQWDSRESMWVQAVILILIARCQKFGEILDRHLATVDSEVLRVVSVVLRWIGTGPPQLVERNLLILWTVPSPWMTCGMALYCPCYQKAQRRKKEVC